MALCRAGGGRRAHRGAMSVGGSTLKVCRGKGIPGMSTLRDQLAATVAALLDARWWDLPPERVATLIPLLQSDRIRELIAAVKVLQAQSS